MAATIAVKATAALIDPCVGSVISVTTHRMIVRITHAKPIIFAAAFMPTVHSPRADFPLFSHVVG
jgi:hypothetical protein